ncbi:hypothetical protein [Luteimonas sp. FCS-9]|uniref:hypothetical protein n=1 Tax=Luteimonas sp. FCS-9 TaxID=1547516 RepID=UPI00063EB15D|nr:hypothetical protein [Luteimonas sp. FCS-9]KLJ02467.1 30S ribosomal protein S3 [Luteimonas sp. FCS-9]
MDVAIVVVVSALALGLHVVLFVVFRRWMDRDLALSFAGDDPARRAYMLARLQQARAQGIRRRALPDWLARAAADAPGDAPAP